MTVPEEYADLELGLLRRLETLGIPITLHRHAALHTVAESKTLRGDLPGLHVKNLFLRDKKRRRWLVTVHEDREIDLKSLRSVLGARGGLSFGSAEALQELLAVAPGGVTPVALVHDSHGEVEAVLDASLLQGSVVNVHPMHNQATIALAPADLVRFLEACGHPPTIIDFDAIA